VSAYDRARAAFDAYATMDAPALPAEATSALQVRLHRWAAEQFPGERLEHPALGVGGELGELAEAVVAITARAGFAQEVVLKHSRSTGKYATPERARVAAADAIADVAIFLARLCTRLRLDFGELLRATAEEVLQRNYRQLEQGGQK
jgi:hypothetical protein